MKKQILFTLIILVSSVSIALSQQSYLKNRYSFKFGISLYPKSSDFVSKPLNLRMEANYGLWRCVEAGAYFGIGQYWYWGPIENNISSGEKVISPFFGLQTNFHILPLLIKKSDFRFDLYLAAKYGSHFFNVPEGSSPPRGFNSEYGLGIGLAFYPWKHMGFYTEYSIGKYSYYADPVSAGFEKELSSNFRFGISFKYKKLNFFKKK